MQKTTEPRKLENIRPLGEWVVILPDVPDEEMTPGGIVIPTARKDKRRRGTVLAVGPGKWLELGKRAEPEVKAGDRVLYMHHNILQGALDVEDTRGQCLIPGTEIIAVLEPTEGAPEGL